MLLTPKELAKRWSTATNTLARWRVSRVGPKYLKMGEGTRSRVRYRLSDIEDYERSNQHLIGQS